MPNIGKTMYARWPSLTPHSKCNYIASDSFGSDGWPRFTTCQHESQIVVGLLDAGEIWMFLDVCGKHHDQLIRQGEAIANPKRKRTTLQAVTEKSGWPNDC